MTKEISLTFDDGPHHPYTNQILEVLDHWRIPATFFVCGANIERYPDITRRITNKGHLMGNHTFFHQITSGIYEIDRTQALIEDQVFLECPIFQHHFG